MARKQSDYLASLLSDDDETMPVTEQEAPPSSPVPEPDQAAKSKRGMTLLNRESALARVVTGQVRQVTQLLLDPARVRVWAGNARSYSHLSEESCRELIDSIIAEGGQKVPAVVRRIEGDPDHEYEVIAGTRRHWSISWLRAHSYPDMQFVAQVVQLDDEAAFRLADLENRARKDVSDLERARNYAEALKEHYGNHMTRMAERLKLSKGWLSKMLKAATIPDEVLAAFATPADVQLKPAYSLACALDDDKRAGLIRREAKRLVSEQTKRQSEGRTALPAVDVFKILLAASEAGRRKLAPMVITSSLGRRLVTVQTSNRQGVTLRLHSGSGASEDDLLNAVREALLQLESEGRGLQR